MSGDRASIDLWSEIEEKLASSPGEPRASQLAAVNLADSEWLRRTENSKSGEELLTEALDQHGTYFHRVIIQGARCSTTPDLLRTLGDALEFPSYYGMNWDALNECLLELLTVVDDRIGSYFGDRMGRRARGLLLTIDTAEHLLENEARNQFDTLLDVFRWAASRPADPLGRDLPRGQFLVLLRVTPGASGPGNVDSADL